MAPLAILVLLASAALAQPVRFEPHLLASDLRGGYQTLAADINRDGKPDLVALGQGMRDLLWFENPGWERHVLATGLSGMVNCVLVGREIVLASGFSSRPRQSRGTVSVLRPGEDVTQPWTATEIDQLPSSHRLRLARIDDGPPVVVNAPLAASDAEPPDYRGATPLVYYRPGAWKRETIGEEEVGVVHGILVTDWDGDGRDEILVASFAGIHLYRLGKDGRWTRTKLADGDPAPWPKSGASDLALGKLGPARFLAAIEPWHGNQVAFYRETDGKWQRRVIFDALSDGHALLAADFNGDGRDEIVAGHRGRTGQVYLLWSADAAGSRWEHAPLDPAMAASSCVSADLNADGRPDLACIDSSQLKWYENLGH